MSVSQNARFLGELPGQTDDEHPPGLVIARLLADELPSDGVVVTDVENWRDCGWVVECTVDGHQLDLVVSRTVDDWFVQIAPRHTPGFVRRLLGARVPDTAPQCFAVATSAASILQTHGCHTFRWRLDGPPGDDDPSTPVPP